VDHDLIRIWGKLHRHPHHRKAASSGIGKVNRGNSWLRCTISSIAFSEADPEKQLCYVTRAASANQNTITELENVTTHPHAGAGHADHPSAAEKKYRS
jgi:hypothetical protein